MDRETYNLTWHSFETSAKECFKQLLSDANFVDVTLVTDDDKHIKAHKVILSASSSVLSQMISKNPHPHPMIFLIGTKYKNIRKLIDFIYLGQAEVFQDDLDSFMDLANQLKIKGLTQEGENGLKKVSPFSPTREDFLESTALNIDPFNSSLDNSSSEMIKEEFDIPESQDNSVDENFQEKNSSGKFSCDQCAFTAFYKSNVNRHKRAQHDGIKYPCNQCEFRTSWSFDLKKHIAKQHTPGSLYSRSFC